MSEAMRNAISRRRQDTDRGAALIELAIALPFFVLMALGIVEMGMAWTTSQRVQSAVSIAARTAASQGAVASADSTTLSALSSALDSESLNNLALPNSRVYIYKANGLSNDVSPCKPGSWTGGTAYDQWQYTAATPHWTQLTTGFTPTSRKSHLINPTSQSPPDSVGVCIKTQHNQVTGSFWGNFVITKSANYQIEPPVGG